MEAVGKEALELNRNGADEIEVLDYGVILP